MTHAFDSAPARHRPARRAVLLFARRPGEEARRKHLTRGKRLFELGRDRVLTAAAQLPDVTPVLLGDPGDATLPAGTLVLAQRGRGFGARLGNGLEDAFALGFDEVVAVGLDAPSLSDEHLDAAFRALREAPVVLGPAADGGVYLLGLRAEADRVALWRGVRWQTRFVLRQLQLNAPARVLPQVLTDVDQRADAQRLARFLVRDFELRVVLEALLARPWTPALSFLPAPLWCPHLPLSRRGPPARVA